MVGDDFAPRELGLDRDENIVSWPEPYFPGELGPPGRNLRSHDQNCAVGHAATPEPKMQKAQRRNHLLNYSRWPINFYCICIIHVWLHNPVAARSCGLSGFRGEGATFR